MLLLTRKKGEAIIIGENLCVRVLHIDRPNQKPNQKVTLTIHQGEDQPSEYKLEAGDVLDIEYDGRQVQVAIVHFRIEQLCIGIQAPREIPVYREEIALRMRAEREESVT